MTEHAAVFDGLDDYIEIADHPDYPIAGLVGFWRLGASSGGHELQG